MLQADLIKLFEYVEPAEVNFSCYSFRIHELLVRACIEIEANFKAILRENDYVKSGNWNIQDYQKTEASHFLSEYQIKPPDFLDRSYTFRPYKNWENNGSLSWYQAYNSSKHDRHNQFQEANFENLLNAICGLFVLIAAQFHTEDLSGGPDLLTVGNGANDGFDTVAGGLFRVKFPNRGTFNEMYDFQHDEITDEASFFQSYKYG